MNMELMKQSQIRCKRRAYERQTERAKEKYLYIENSNLIRFSNRCGSHINCFRFSLSENREHIIKKLDICIELKQLNHEFITEAIFVNNSRADVVDLTTGEIYEILCSESEENFEEKIKNYPKDFRVIKIRVKNI